MLKYTRTAFENIARFMVDMILILFAMVTIVFIYWFMANNIGPTTEVRNFIIVGTDRVAVGDVVEVSFEARRHRDCELRSSRVFRRPDNREIELQTVTQTVRGDPLVWHKVGFSVRITPGMLTPEEWEVTGVILTHVRYFCNGLDYVFPRYFQTPPVKLTVTR